MKKFAEFIIKFPKTIIVITIAITLILGYFMKDLKINSDILSYLPQDDPVVVLFNEVGDKFGGNSLAMIALENKDIFNFETLTRIRKLTKEFEKVENVSHVMSMTNILDIKKTEWGLEIGKLIDQYEVPESKNELEKLKSYTLSRDMYSGNLVSSDGRVSAIICRVKEGVDKTTVGKQLKRITREIKGKEKIYYAGIPFQMSSIDEIIVKDVKKLVPLVIILVIITLYFSFKSFRGVVLPLSTVLFSTIWALGLMSLSGISVSLVTNAIPILLIAIGSAYGIHMMTKYYEDVHDEKSKKDRIKDALKEVGVPIILTGITTAIGFLSFLGAYINMIREFAVFIALGVFFALVITITFIPAVLSLLKVKKIRQNGKKIENTAITRFMDCLSNFVLRREKLIVLFAIIIVITAIFGLFRLRREVNMLEYFNKKHEIRITEKMMQDRFGGSIPVQILVKGDIKNPFVLKEMIKIEKYLETLPDINNPQSVADLVCEMNDVMNDRYTIPETVEGVANLWFFLEGQDVLEQLVDDDASQALIQAKLGTVDTKKMIPLVKKINTYLQTHIKKDLIEFKLDTVSPEVKEIIEKQKVSEIADNIRMDIEKRQTDYNFNKYKLNQILYLEFAEKDSKISVHGISMVKEQIKKYLSSDESDIEISSQKVINKISYQIGVKLEDGTISPEHINSILKKNISLQMVSGDYEAIQLTAESVKSIIDETAKKDRVDSLLGKIKGLFPAELQKDEKFLKEIKDDLWLINENRIALSRDSYSHIVSNPESHNQPLIKLSLKQTGMPLIFKNLDEQIVKSQIQSLILAVFLVFILLTIQLKSFAGGLIGLIPIVLTVMVNFGLMAYLGVALDVCTVLIGSVAVGIGIDYTIHFLSRFRTEFEHCKSPHEALDKTLETTGVAILINAVSVSMGFLVLLFGSISPMRQFGWLMAVTMLTSAFGAITVLPAVILVAHAGFIGSFDKFANNLTSKIKEKIKNKGGIFNEKN